MVDSLTMYARPAASPPQVQLELIWNARTTATIERLDPDGRWRPVRTGEPATLTSGLWSGFDVEVPYGAAVSYRATDDGDTLTGLTVAIEPTGGGFVPEEFTDEFDLTSGPSGPVPPLTTVRLDVKIPWLVHPGVPALSQPLTIVRAMSARSRPARRGIHEVMNSPTPLVVSQRRSSARYELVVGTETDLQRRAMDVLLDDGSTLLLNVPAIRTGPLVGIPTEYVSVGDTDENRLLNYGPEPRRNWTLPLIVCTRPVGGQVAQWSYQTAQAEYPTYADSMDAFESYVQLLYNQPAV